MVHAHTNVMQVRGAITLVNDTIGSRIERERVALGLTQEQLAIAAGVTQGTIGNVEKGLRKKPRELISIARALKVRPEYLETGRGPKEVDGLQTSAPNAPLSLEQALPVVLQAIGRLTDGQWRMVRARLDDMAGHPEMCDDVAADVAPLLHLRHGKQRAAG